VPHARLDARLARTLFAGLVLGGAIAACTLPREGALSQRCTLAAECDDGNPCTVEACEADGLCRFEVLDGDPPQVNGDCRRAFCLSGFVHHEPAADPPDDENDCTDDVCEDGEPIHVPYANGKSCTLPEGQGHCVAGECKKVCDSDAKCNDGNDCTEDDCDTQTGFCTHVDLDDVEAPQQLEGDCRITLCDAGTELDAVDDSDVPDDGNDCTVQSCNEGTAETQILAPGTECADGDDPLAHVCDAAGQCVQCNGPTDCTWLAPGDACHERHCQGGQCASVDQPQGSPLPPAQQQVGDCHEWVCDGMGGSTEVVDDTDVPDDGRECTVDSCTLGVADNAPMQQGTACGLGGALVCDLDGDCVGCNAPTDCNGTDDFCGQRTCNGQVCGMSYTAAGTALPAAQQTTGDCLELRCNGAGAVVAVAIADPLVDGNVCTADVCNNGVPSNPPQPLDFPCNQGGTWCNGNGQCVQCNSPLQCPQGAPCQSAQCDANTCALADLPQGTTAPGSLQTDGDCKTVVCNGMGAPDPTPQVQDADLPVDGNQCTDDVCTNGVPSFPPEPAGDPCNQNGGVVCNGSAVAPACVECATSAQCPPTEGCDTSSWTCKLLDGQTCSMPVDCLGNLCVDARCCNSACTGLCRACNVGGSEGTCTFLAPGTDPVDECAGADVCNGSGACSCFDGMQNGGESDVDCGGGVCVDCNAGQACFVNGDCTSNVCAGGVCQPALCGDGVVNGNETCDFMSPSTPCCSASCGGPLPDGTTCGADPDGPDGCAAQPRCNGLGTGVASCVAQDQPPSTPCNDLLFCNGTDTCDGGGSCQNHAGDPCLGPDGDGDCMESCDEAADDCLAPDLDGSACTNNLFCDGPETCTAGMCGGSSGDPCPGPDGDADCAESCDEAADDCLAPDPNGSSCDDGLFCDGTETCSAGLCGGSTGDPCPGPDGDGDCMESCDETADDCLAPDLDGSACTNNVFCDGDEICGSGMCGGSSGDPCPGPDGDANCSESCDEAGDVCTAPDGLGASCNDGVFCTAVDTCDASAVCIGTGNPCPGHDAGTSCDDSCDETTMTCTAPDAASTFCDEMPGGSAGLCTGTAVEPNCAGDT
jgi:hypothetical protein